MNRGLTVSALPLCTALFLTGCSEGSEPAPEASAELMATESADPASAQAAPQRAGAEAPTESPSDVDTTDVDTTSADSLTVVVNKHNPLDPQSYVPADLQEVEGHQLRAEAASAAQNMLRDMRADGVNVTITSAYRSYDTQVSTYDHWVQQNGQVTADRVSARPGFSEHQTGLALDWRTARDAIYRLVSRIRRLLSGLSRMRSSTDLFCVFRKVRKVSRATPMSRGTSATWALTRHRRISPAAPTLWKSSTQPARRRITSDKSGC